MSATFFETEDIEDLREVAESNMVTALIYRLKPIGTGDGFRAKGSQKWPTDYAVNITTLGSYEVNPARGQETMVGGQVRSSGDWLVDLKWDAGAGAEDKVVIADRSFNLISDRTDQYKVTQKFDANEIR